MPELTIRLRSDPDTGRPVITVGLVSEDDTPAMEHERQHRDLVGRLVNGAGCGDEGPVVVERESHGLRPVGGLG